MGRGMELEESKMENESRGREERAEEKDLRRSRTVLGKGGNGG